jgi:ferric-dicitrate binding protein FerR (iron transport regulator)
MPQSTPSAHAAPPAHEQDPRRRRIRRSALLFALIAAAFYCGFILMTLVRGWK